MWISTESFSFPLFTVLIYQNRLGVVIADHASHRITHPDHRMLLHPYSPLRDNVHCKMIQYLPAIRRFQDSHPINVCAAAYTIEG